MVANKSGIISEEKEETVGTVGQKSRCCFCPTELLFPLTSSLSGHFKIFKMLGFCEEDVLSIHNNL